MGYDVGVSDERYEGPMRDVSIGYAFALGQTEVTQAQNAEFVRSTGHVPVTDGSKRNWPCPCCTIKTWSVSSPALSSGPWESAEILNRHLSLPLTAFAVQIIAFLDDDG